MFGALLVPLFLLSSDLPETAPSSILVLDLKAAGIDADQASILNDIVGQSVARYPDLKVITTADVRRMADVDTARALLGCDDASCLAEIAGDFGARYILYGSVASLGGLYVIQLTLFDSQRAEALRRTRVETRDLSAVTRQIDAAVDDVCAPLLVASGAPQAKAQPPSEAEPASEPEGLLSAGVWIAAAGVAVTALGASVWGLSALPAGAYNDTQRAVLGEQARFEGSHAAALESAVSLQARADQEAALYATLAIGGAALSALGVALAGTGVVLWLAE